MSGLLDPRLIAAMSRGILADTRMRRSVLFVLAAGATLLVFAGAVLLDRWLAVRIWCFLLYWGACAWLTFTVLLLALYDLLAVRRDAALERRRLRESLRKPGKDDPGRDHPAAP